jgi:hypothetical protein
MLGVFIRIYFWWKGEGEDGYPFSTGAQVYFCILVMRYFDMVASCVGMVCVKYVAGKSSLC